MNFFALINSIIALPYFLSLSILSLLCILGYVIGGIPTGYWFAKLLFGINITKHGSGNIGATNVARVLGRYYFLPIFFIDALKAYGCLAICTKYMLNVPVMMYSSDFLVLIMAAALLIGNRFSPFLNFRGGKGVATAVGILGFISPYTSVPLFCMTWAFMVGELPIPAYIASLISMLLTTIHFYFMHNPSNSFIFLFIFMNCWLVFTHLPNIRNKSRSTSL